MSFESHLIDHPLNRRNFEELRNSFDRDSFIPFVGAGPSTTMGEPDWYTLFRELKSHFGVRVNKVKRPDGTLDYPRMFSKLYKKIHDKTIFFKSMFEKLEPTKTRYTGFHISLVDLFGIYLTTNYDSPIEMAFRKQHPDAQLTKHYFSGYDLENLENCVIYLHGHKDINFGIIKLEDYEYFYPTVSKKAGIPILEDFLSKIFETKTLVFVGFSFDDYFFSDYLIYLSDTVTPARKHFSLLGESSEVYDRIRTKVDEYKKAGKDKTADDEMSRFFQGFYGISPIVYKEDSHVVIEDMFDELEKILPVPVTTGELGAEPVR